MGPESPTVEREIARQAEPAHGLVRRRGLLSAGISSGAIRHRLRTGALLHEHRGIYRVGHRAPSLEATYLGAVLACGDEALLRRLAAAHLLGLLGGSPPPPEVLAPTERRVSGIAVERSRWIDPADRFVHRSIPVTSPARTLVDLAAVLAAEELARACHEAGVRHRTSPRHVSEVLNRRPSSPGAAKLRSIMSGDTRVTLSRLEARFLERLGEAKLPLPATNTRAGGRRVDCRWAQARLTVELDGYRYHGSRYAWEQDRQREREARARGDEFRRYSYGDIFESPAYMLAELRELLAR